jgi:hypothetical protein
MADAIGISLRINPATHAQAQPGLENSDLAPCVGRSARTAITIMMAVGGDPPAGEVQLGTQRWCFANRVEMLEAIDAACEQAISSAIRTNHP